MVWKFLTCQSERAFPIKSTYNSVDKRPVGLLETKKALSVCRPVQGSKTVPIFYCDLASWLA